MFGIGKENSQILNPELGLGAKVIQVVSVLIFLMGIQGGLIGGAIGGVLAFGFSNVALKMFANYKKVRLYVEAPPPSKEEIEKKEKASSSRKKFWIIFLGIFFFILFLTWLFFGA